MPPMKRITELFKSPPPHSSDVPEAMRTLYTNTISLRRIVADIEREALIAMQTTSWPNETLYHFDNARTAVIGVVDGVGARLGRMKALLAYIEATPEFKEADATITPRLEYEAEVRAKEEAKRRDLDQKRMNLEQARKAAEARALANLDKDVELQAAQRALDEAQR